ncbi:MAG: hypothetical protein LBS09_02290 [Bacteroidales bacterium]|nr:hypothetical protein [Bacteroidales bacterium]
MSLRMFADDAETVLHNKYGIDGWIGVQGEHRDARRLLCAYLDEKLTVEANHREKVVLTVDSIVVHEEALWVYMQGRTEDIIRHVTVQQRVLTDFFRTQSNLVIISTGKKEEGYKLDKGKDKIELTIE